MHTWCGGGGRNRQWYHTFSQDHFSQNLPFTSPCNSTRPHLLRPLFQKRSLHITMKMKKTNPSLKTTFSKTLFKSLCKQIRPTVSLRLPLFFFFRNPPFTSSCKIEEDHSSLKTTFSQPPPFMFPWKWTPDQEPYFLKTFYLTLMCGLKRSPHLPPTPPHTHTLYFHLLAL